MCPRALLAVVLVCIPAAAIAQESPPPGATVQAPVPASEPLADKTAVLSGDLMPAVQRPDARFGMDLMLGQMTGIRPSMAVYDGERSAVLVEGFYGALFTKFGASEGAGAGVRWVTTSQCVHSVTFGPGVDVLFHLNDGEAIMLAPTVDVAWRRNFGERAAFLLGLNAGIGVGLSGREDDRHSRPVSGRVTPLISMFTGLRF